jgi:hypothetical protein
MPRRKNQEEVARRGRPPKPAAEKFSAALNIKMTKADRSLIEAVAEGEPTAWARCVLLRAAKRLAGSAQPEE